MSEQPRFRVEIEEGPAHGDLYELEQTTYFQVIDRVAGAAVMTFEGEMSARLDGGVWSDHQYSGVRDVAIMPDQRFVRVSFHDGREETIPLPK
jgi:hypothetical protein